MNKSTLSALVAALMLGSGITGYLIGKPGDSLDRAAPPARTATAPAPPPAAAPQTPAASSPAPTPAALPTTTPAPAAPAEAFAYRRLSIDNSAAEADSCLFFNKPLATGDTVKYADYVRIAPEVKSALRVVDDKLCIGGLTYGQDYSVTLLAGFPGADGSRLADERKVELALGPRPAVISLPGKGFVLPRGTAVGLPITTVNVGKVALAVYRVNERGLDKFIDRYDASFPGSEPMTEHYALRQWLNGDNGKRIWRGTMGVRNVLNQPVTTAFPIRETVQDWKPGAYFVVAWNAADGSIRENDGEYGEDDESRKTVAGMWVMDTDIALTTLTGRDGLTVFARSIASAQPLPEHEVVLLSRGNEPIGKAVTGADGRATFPAGLLRGRGAAEATSIMVTDAGKQEFSRLELTKAAFDLSDRGIDGRASPARSTPSSTPNAASIALARRCN